MSGAFLLAQYSVLAVAMLTLIASAACAVIYPRMRSSISEVEPAQRARILLLLCAAPVLIGLLLTAVCFLPSLVQSIWTSADHCPHHAAGHSHLCLAHLPTTGHGIIAWILAGVALAALVTVVAKHAFDSVRSGRLLEQLVRAGHRDEMLGVWIADTQFPMALTAGYLQRRIVVSTGLLEHMPPELLNALLAHEHAHARRRDPLRKLIARIASVVHLPGTRRQLLDDLALATEQSCDEEAGAAIGDRLRVAQAMLAVERLAQQHDNRGVDLGLAAEYFGRVSITPRVEALLSARPRRSSPMGVWAAGLTALALAVLIAEPIHHATETLLGLIAR